MFIEILKLYKNNEILIGNIFIVYIRLIKNFDMGRYFIYNLAKNKLRLDELIRLVSFSHSKLQSIYVCNYRNMQCPHTNMFNGAWVTYRHTQDSFLLHSSDH